jgi:hypothetical protein
VTKMRWRVWLGSRHATDLQLSPLLLAGMLMFFTVFVKGIPLVTLINEKIGGDKFDPSGEAIVVEGTLFVIRSCVKFVVMNAGCALSDHLGRKPITLFFILPNICMDLMLLFAEIDRSVIFSIGALWGLTAITVPTLRAWVCDLSSLDSVEMVNAQGSFRGLTIGPATLIGIPLGTAFALYSNPKYAFVCSLVANVLAVIIIAATSLDDTLGIARRQKMESDPMRSASTATSDGQIQLMKQGDQSPLHPGPEPALSVASAAPSRQQSPVSRSFPSEGIVSFCLAHAPWSGYEAIRELCSSSAGTLWLVYFLTFCANEVRCLSSLRFPSLTASPLPLPCLPSPSQTFIHTLFNYLMIGGGMSPVQAACAFALAGVSYSVSTEHMLRLLGGVRGNLIGMVISAAM